jgi:hypothetical protein
MKKKYQKSSKKMWPRRELKLMALQRRENTITNMP